MDIYIPSQSHTPTKAADKAVQQATQRPEETPGQHGSEAVHGVEDSKQLPVALFCHGGVWATGEPHLNITRSLAVTWTISM